MSKIANNNYNWFNNPNYLNSVNYELSYNFNLTEKINLFYALNDTIMINLKDLFDIEYIQKYKEYIQVILNDVVKIEFPYNMNEILKDIIEIKFYDVDIQEHISNEIILEDQDIINRLNYKTQYLFDVINTYDTYVYNHPNKQNILKEVFKSTHSINTRYSNEKLNNWIDNFPNFIDSKIQAIKNKKKDEVRSKKQKKRYKESHLRFLNIIRKMNSLGYYDFNEDQIKPKMKLLEDDEIIQDLINAISDQFGNDHDMLIINENKQNHPKEDYYVQKEEEDYYEYLIINHEILTERELNDFEKLKIKFGDE